MNTERSSQAAAGDSAPSRAHALWLRGMLAALLLLAVVGYYFSGLHRYLDWSVVRAHLTDLQDWVQDHLLLAVVVYFLLYVTATALSLPAAGVLSILAGALFGRWLGGAIVSVASTAGATLAFLSSRYVLGAWVQARFGGRLTRLNEGVRRSGAYYLFMLRMVPLVPFFLINLGMGLTRMRVTTFVWVSWLGMLPGTFLYVNAGTALATVGQPGDILTPEVLVSLLLLAVAPLLLRWVVGYFMRRRQPSGESPPS